VKKIDKKFDEKWGTISGSVGIGKM